MSWEWLQLDGSRNLLSQSIRPTRESEHDRFVLPRYRALHSRRILPLAQVPNHLPGFQSSPFLRLPLERTRKLRDFAKIGCCGCGLLPCSEVVRYTVRCKQKEMSPRSRSP